MPDKLSLQWTDFKKNVNSAFGRLRDDKEFSDVTLVCEDGQQLEAHKIVLASSSPLFSDILKNNNHAHPLIFMRSTQLVNLEAILDFLYFGEANVFQDHLDSFLTLAEDLKVKGLQGRSEKYEYLQPAARKPVAKQEPIFHQTTSKLKNVILRPHKLEGEQPITLMDQSDSSTDLEGLDYQIESMIELGERIIKTGSVARKARICKVCGKEGILTDIKRHIESLHITGASHPCDICGNTFRSRRGLAIHMNGEHRK